MGCIGSMLPPKEVWTMMAGYVWEWSIKSSETTATGLPVFAEGIVLVFDACLCEGLAQRVVVVVRLFASLLLSNVYEMSTRSTFVLVFDACLCEGLAQRVVVVVRLLACCDRQCRWQLFVLGCLFLLLNACFCCSMLAEWKTRECVCSREHRNLW